MIPLRKGLLAGFYYYLLITTAISFFVFISTFNNIDNGNAATATLRPAFVELARLMWGSLLALHAIGLFAVIVFKRNQLKTGSGLFALFSVLILAVFIVPSLYFLIHLIWSSRGAV